MRLFKLIKNNDLKYFGLIWSFIFIIIAFYPLISNDGIRIWSFIFSIIIIVISFFRPNYLFYFYKFWIKVGDILGKIISKVILFILFFALFTPISLFLKLLGKDLLNKKIHKKSVSYWRPRNIQPKSMNNQF